MRESGTDNQRCCTADESVSKSTLGAGGAAGANGAACAALATSVLATSVLATSVLVSASDDALLRPDPDRLWTEP